MLYKEMPYPIVRENQNCMVDLYVKIRNDYRLFAAKGALFTREHCQLFSKSSAKLYIRTSEDETAEEYLNSYVNDVVLDPSTAPEVKAEIVYTSTMNALRKIFQGLNRRTLAELEKTSVIVARLILSDRNVLNDLVTITSHDHLVYKHSIKVGMYGTALAVHLFGTGSGHNIAALSTALFLHDIGMTRVPHRILDKKEPLSDAEREVVRKHPIWGHDRLMNVNYLTAEAASVVLFHHERCNGTGYPFGKSGTDIPLYARICAIADTFETLLSAAPSGQPRTPFDALRIMQQEIPGKFDTDLFKAFITMLGPGA